MSTTKIPGRYVILSPSPYMVSQAEGEQAATVVRTTFHDDGTITLTLVDRFLSWSDAVNAAEWHIQRDNQA